MKWRGYAPARLWQIDPPGWAEEIVIELTPDAMEDLAGRDPRGLAVDLSREKPRTSPLKLVLSAQQPTGPVPQGFNVRPILCRLWGVPNEQECRDVQGPQREILKGPFPGVAS
jgi:hypothetical protein